MLRMAASDSARALTMPVRSPLSSVMPALSIATSVPVPMAMPTCGGGERRGVVDAVAGHGDDAAVAREFFDHRAFLFGQHVRFDLRDAEAFGDGERRGAVVAGEHDHRDAVGGERLERDRAWWP